MKINFNLTVLFNHLRKRSRIIPVHPSMVIFIFEGRVLPAVLLHCTYLWILMPQRDISTPEEHLWPAGRNEPGPTEDHVGGNCLIESY